MNERTTLVLTVIGNDRPGIVESIADIVRGHEANWEESRMARLASRFAGILRVTVPPEKADKLAHALLGLITQGLKIVVEPTGCLGFAAACHAGLPLAGKRVGVIVSGGNVDLARFAQLIGPQAAA